MTAPSPSLSERVAHVVWEGEPLDLVQRNAAGEIVVVVSLDRAGCCLRDEPRAGVSVISLLVESDELSVGEILRSGGVKIESGTQLLRDLRAPLRKAFESSTLSE